MNKNTKHTKHAKLERPQLGTFARREVAFLGTPCGVIQQLSRQLIDQLGRELKVAYVDADHGSGDEAEAGILPHSQLTYTDKISFQRLDLRVEADSFQYRQWFNGQDLVLVNGNHFRAEQQIVFVDPRKFESLERKLDRLTGVVGFIKLDAATEIPDFLKTHLPDWQALPVWQADEVAAIGQFIRDQFQRQLPPVKGLVLAGGKSQRMGRDKGQLNYHGRPQREYLYQLMETQLGIQAYLSCRADQVEDMPSDHRTVVDSFLGLGPYGAILSAFREDPNAAWLVVACDLPFVDESGLQYLLDQRGVSAVATAFHNPATNFPDPLLTLWEPRAYPVLLQFLSQGYSCPRKVLINTPVHTVNIPNEHLLTNVNNPAEFEKAKTILAKAE
ncbi:NTP transferase domain-containing protein [Flavilitoribacter nigricans]|uniref:Molybdopterin-guanine dinucleotide biosynthesis protein MobA n=1 Tax=Flavilitoribacter nigricans (strain ATCC 23147 / DSM 23189 / NBRC 102662 / NCIMB 1420 / SS-2) TaxID=1122177 RepID=A0A2D0N5L4_FLAN2|nr:NTP transferase domain-containing protein [Flavilitoribacter nigricans]PHN03801.1 molybdopterin-guanine dinucleotide biosynthesis protein MobA [Flavilitoribacter nigricans DSM 23189 = NBRC 102662]